VVRGAEHTCFTRGGSEPVKTSCGPCCQRHNFHALAEVDIPSASAFHGAECVDWSKTIISGSRSGTYMTSWPSVWASKLVALAGRSIKLAADRKLAAPSASIQRRLRPVVRGVEHT
jgi:hypothetical protein